MRLHLQLYFLFGEKIEVPAHEINELDRKQSEQGGEKRSAAPVRLVGPEIEAHSDVERGQRQTEEGNDRNQLTSRRRGT